MNRNIKKLAAKARGDMVALTTVDEVEWARHEEFVGKFAQLIINDCIAQCNSQNTIIEIVTGNTHWGTITDATDQIKKHFGIKE